MNKILLIGPCFNKKEESIIGGTITLFENLVSALKKNNIDIDIVDSNKKNYKNIFIAYISIFIQITNKCKRSDVISLHSSKDYFIIAPYLLLIGAFFNKKVSLRHFGMTNKEAYSRKFNIVYIIQKWIFTSVDRLFFETKNLVNVFLKINSNTYWFPNVRSRELKPAMPRNFNKRFVFIGRIIEEKGIDEILKASVELNDSYSIDIYGPIVDKKYTTEYFQNYNVQYFGALRPENVLDTLNKYDVLLLPSYYDGEGYPGVIIEAYSLGIPVITTKWQDIVEIVESRETGMLVEPKNVNELVQAIEFFNDKNYLKISQNAYVKFDEFNSDVQTKLFLERLELEEWNTSDKL